MFNVEYPFGSPEAAPDAPDTGYRVDSAPSRIDLPPTPDEFSDNPVIAWSEPVSIDTYMPAEPDIYPAFLESRVYQGSSGRVFPLPFHEKLSHKKAPHQWQAIHLENQWVRLMILPELGGRIHVGYDKSSDYDFFYRNNVIKPALVGLAGPWIAGGVEFNWPQHHRPATFLPTDVEIEHEADGAITVWCSDHDPFARMKGMHGIRLRPDSSVIEARVRLYNRSDQTQTFLWWANVAVRVHDGYQSFFPTDVHAVADHAKRAFTTFPRAEGHYYGVDYPAQVSRENPDGDRLDWYRNITVPTSYMVVDTQDDFFGGYDHHRKSGFVHLADHALAPGKKQWTWGNTEFGRAWDANLTDTDGPYVELMAGVYTDNQPDFSYIAAGETKTFSQYWFPIRGMGPAHQATTSAAVRVDLESHESATLVRIGVSSTGVHPAAVVRLSDLAGRVLHESTVELAPGTPATLTVKLDASYEPSELLTSVESDGIELVGWCARAEGAPRELPPAATEPPVPGEVESVEELFLIGQYLEQYRHATRSPEPYWEEALRRDSGDVRSSIALASRHHQAANFGVAETLLRVATDRLTSRVSSPADGEAHYRLGLTLIAQGRDEEAGAALATASWSAAWRTPAQFALARMASRAGDYPAAERAAREVLRHDAEHLQAADLLAVLLSARGRNYEAISVMNATLAIDPLDQWARHLKGLPLTADAPTLLDIALEYSSAGFTDRALVLLDRAAEHAPATALGQVQAAPLIAYHRAALMSALGREDEARLARIQAQTVDGRYAQASRLDDIAVLESALISDPGDGRAALLLGNWYYNKRRYFIATTRWRQALDADTDSPTRATAARNLGIAAYNVDGNPDAAVAYFERAIAIMGEDAKLWYEFDQLASRTGVSPEERLQRLRVREAVVSERDDLTISYAGLLVASGEATLAREILAARRFQPWEGGEGAVLQVWESVALALAGQAMSDEAPDAAVAYLRSALDSPANLGEARHPLANSADLHLALGDALAAAGDAPSARAAWRQAASFSGDFRSMSAQPYSVQTSFSILALERLGEFEAAGRLTAELEEFTRRLTETPTRIDFFATSLPAMLLFHDDPQRARNEEVRILRDKLAELNRASRVPRTPLPFDEAAL
ncbi:DUF5107 domain-containing protein [Arthrobacter sp. FW306-04-A]|uniref:DUF5107 domain-containing protein n=1 Tax=Arthrobacter sp. FW306-04-A TaxID=2879619 RepID=UPI0037C079EA|nr:DUF5107 domain-containing protein [Arthrobacter sp. FW306-04-A]